MQGLGARFLLNVGRKWTTTIVRAGSSLAISLVITIGGLAAAQAADQITSPANKRFPIYRSQKLGFINELGQEVIPTIYSNKSSGFSEERTPVQVGGNWGHIDSSGRTITPFKYQKTYDFREGYAAVVENSKFGFVDTTGKLVIPVRFEGAYRFSEGLAPVMLNGRWGYINYSGNIVISASQESFPGEFQNGIARVGQPPFTPFGAINRQGQLVLAKKYYQQWCRSKDPFFSEGLEPVKLQEQGQYGFINRSGDVVIPPQYDQADAFSEGLARVSFGSSHGYIDKTGKLLIDHGYVVSSSFSEGRARVGIIEPETDCGNGWQSKNGKWGYIDTTGRLIIPLIYSTATDFSGGLAHISVGEPCKSKKNGYINRQGIQVVPATFDGAEPFMDGLALVRAGSQCGYINARGQWVWRGLCADWLEGE